jgi:hypothetical protein
MSLPPDADRRRTAPSYYILTYLGQRDEPPSARIWQIKPNAIDAAITQTIHSKINIGKPRSSLRVSMLCDNRLDAGNVVAK